MKKFFMVESCIGFFLVFCMKLLGIEVNLRLSNTINNTSKENKVFILKKCNMEFIFYNQDIRRNRRKTLIYTINVCHIEIESDRDG